MLGELHMGPSNRKPPQTSCPLHVSLPRDREAPPLLFSHLMTPTFPVRKDTKVKKRKESCQLVSCVTKNPSFNVSFRMYIYKTPCKLSIQRMPINTSLFWCNLMKNTGGTDPYTPVLSVHTSFGAPWSLCDISLCDNMIMLVVVEKW